MDLVSAYDSSSSSFSFTLVRRRCERYCSMAVEMVTRVFCAMISFLFALVGSLVGAVIGASMGLSTESGMIRGAAVGLVSGAVFAIEAVDSFFELWRSSDSEIQSILYLADIICSLFSGRIVWEKVSPAMQRAVQSQMQTSLLSSPFMDHTDLFETGGTAGMSSYSIDKIPEIKVTNDNILSAEGEKICCSVCLQEFQVRETVRVLPHCRHTFHVPCIDGWLVKHGSCPLCRSGVHIDHVDM